MYLGGLILARIAFRRGDTITGHGAGAKVDVDYLSTWMETRYGLWTPI